MFTVTTESGKKLSFSKDTYDAKSLYANAFFQYLDANKEDRAKLMSCLQTNLKKHYDAIKLIGMGMAQSHVNAAEYALRAITMYNKGLIYKNS